jgi:tetratricopeptide (TPR) repeat protein
MIRSFIPVAMLALAADTLAAQQPRLGTIEFRTSATAPAQAEFLRGVLFLHSFEYGDAAAAFREAQRLEPRFALAYWGEALTYNHPLWNEHDRAAALAVLQRLAPTPEARAALAPTDRERRYLEAIELLYGGTATKPRRDTLHSAAMERLHVAYPDDDEAAAFYALSLMGLSQGQRDLPTYIRAGAMALELLSRHPDHPGAAHYVIHAFDDPTHAPLGLAAARAYSRIAPGADHAQHMTTHIFLALGMWDDVVRQNEIASGADRATWVPGHYTYWLQYGLLQQGRVDEARALLELVRRNPGATANARRRAHLLAMRAAQVVNGERWDDAMLGWESDSAGVGAGALALDAFAGGYAALHRGDAAAARQALTRLQALDPAAYPGGWGGQPGMRVALAKELEGALAFERGEREVGLTLVTEAAAIEDGLIVEYGPPDVVKPAHELRGEMLLALGRPAEAQQAFTHALQGAPGRLAALRGLARAARDAGDAAVAERAERRLAAQQRSGG